LGCIDDVVNKVPEAGEEDEYVVYSKKSGSPDQGIRGLVGVVVEYFEEAGVVIIVPICFLFVLAAFAVILR